MKIKLKQVILSLFSFLIVLTIADRIDEYLLRQELKKKYLLGTEHSEYECFDMKVRDHLLHKINTKSEFAKFCIRTEHLGAIARPIFSDYGEDQIIYAHNRIVFPMVENWIEKEFYVQPQNDENGNYRFPVPTADPKKRMYLKEEYR